MLAGADIGNPGVAPEAIGVGHSGFLGGGYGMHGEPDAFAQRLREVLDGA